MTIIFNLVKLRFFKFVLLKSIITSDDMINLYNESCRMKNNELCQIYQY